MGPGEQKHSRVGDEDKPTFRNILVKNSDCYLFFEDAGVKPNWVIRFHR